MCKMNSDLGIYNHKVFDLPEYLVDFHKSDGIQGNFSLYRIISALHLSFKYQCHFIPATLKKHTCHIPPCFLICTLVVWYFLGWGPSLFDPSMQIITSKAECPKFCKEIWSSPEPMKFGGSMIMVWIVSYPKLDVIVLISALQVNVFGDKVFKE